jgi:phosphatidylglycerol:prolipoprotein diacylglycerol transferase
VVFALALHMDQPSRFQLFQMMRKSSRGNWQIGEGLRAGDSAARTRNALQNLKASRIGKSLEDCGTLRARQARRLGCGIGLDDWAHGKFFGRTQMLDEWYRSNGASCRYTAAMFPIGSHPAWHPVFETLAYVAGYAVFRLMRSRQGDVISEPARWNVIAAAAVGALVGSRALGLAEQWPTIISAWHQGHFLAVLIAPGGKTIVGGLLGGWLGVEIVKLVTGIRSRTGDLFALPLCIAIAVGRVGCFIAGLADDTYGKPTALPWAVDFGDHIGRHPVQLYEILFLALLGFVISRPVQLPEGARFRIFVAAYLAWRVVIDFLKPQPLVAGLNMIQWACLTGLAVLGAWSLADRGKEKIAASA